jgi:acetate kinase
LEFLGIEIDEKRNLANKSVISTEDGRVAVHVIPTDEESMIARTVCRVLGFNAGKEDFYEKAKR